MTFYSPGRDLLWGTRLSIGGIHRYDPSYPLWIPNELEELWCDIQGKVTLKGMKCEPCHQLWGLVLLCF